MKYTIKSGVALVDGKVLNKLADGLHSAVDELEFLMADGIVQQELDRLLKGRRDNNLGVVLVYLGTYRQALSRKGRRLNADKYTQRDMLRPSCEFLWSAVRHAVLKPYAIRRRRSSKSLPAGIYLAVTKAKAQL